MPVGEGVMRLSGRDDDNDSNARHVLDVLEDGRIRWCNESEDNSRKEVFQSPLVCRARIWNILWLHSGIMRECLSLVPILLWRGYSFKIIVGTLA